MTGSVEALHPHRHGHQHQAPEEPVAVRILVKGANDTNGYRRGQTTGGPQTAHSPRKIGRAECVLSNAICHEGPSDGGGEHGGGSTENAIARAEEVVSRAARGFHTPAHHTVSAAQAGIHVVVGGDHHPRDAAGAEYAT